MRADAAQRNLNMTIVEITGGMLRAAQQELAEREMVLGTAPATGHR